MRLSSWFASSLFSAVLCFASFSTALAAEQKKDPKLDSDLLTAAAAGDTMAVRRLVPRGANLEVRDGQNGFTPLMWASWRAHIGTIRELLARGAKVNAQTNFSQPAPLILRDYSVVSSSQQNFNGVPATSVLGVGYGALNDGITPLLLAASSGSAIAVKTLLDKGANPNKATISGETPLDAAAAAGYLPSVQWLLQKKANVNSTDISGTTPLGNAVLQGHTAIVQELLGAGAEVKGNWRGYTWTQVAQMFQRREIASLLAGAAKRQEQKSKKSPRAPKTAPAPKDTVTIIKSDGSSETVD